MARSSFVMRPTKSYIGRYILMIYAPPTLYLLIYLLLVNYRILSRNRVMMWMIVSPALMYLIFVVCYFLAKKQCTLEIKNHAIKVTNLFGNTITSVKAKQIRSAKRNYLDELKLFDERGAVLITVCPHLENRHMFEDWLLDHDIRLKSKPRRKLQSTKL